MRPSSCMRSMSSQTFRRARGSSPVVGSSMNTTSGSFTKLAANVNLCFCPPESVFTTLPAFSDSSTICKSFSGPTRREYILPKRFRISVRVSRSKYADDCNCTPTRSLTCSGCSIVFIPRTKVSPSSAFSKPSMHSSMVVLPAPLGPRMPNISPRFTSKETPDTAVSAPNRLTNPRTCMTASDIGVPLKCTVGHSENCFTHTSIASYRQQAG